jgi:hypothetical protein
MTVSRRLVAVFAADVEGYTGAVYFSVSKRIGRFIEERYDHLFFHVDLVARLESLFWDP